MKKYTYPAAFFVGYIFLRNYVSHRNVQHVDDVAFWIALALGGWFGVKHLYRKVIFHYKLPVKIRNHILTDLDFFGENAQLITDVPNEVVRIHRGDKETLIPIEKFGYTTIEQKHSVSGPKVASGIVDGKLVTMQTGDFYDYTVPNGKFEVGFTNAGEYQWVSVIVDKSGLEKFEKVAKRIYALGTPIRERKAKEAALREESKRLEEEARADKEKREKEERKKLAAERSSRENRAFAAECNIDPASALAGNFTADSEGAMLTAIVAAKDGRGGMIYNKGNDKWIGSWRGAKVEISGNNLEILVDDPEYRTKNFTERRVTMEFLNKEQRLAWFDRINILSKG